MCYGNARLRTVCRGPLSTCDKYITWLSDGASRTDTGTMRRGVPGVCGLTKATFTRIFECSVAPSPTTNVKRRCGPTGPQDRWPRSTKLIAMPSTRNATGETLDVLPHEPLKICRCWLGRGVDPRQCEVDRRVEAETFSECQLKLGNRPLVVVGEHEDWFEFDLADLIYIHDEKPLLLLRCSPSREWSWKSGGFVIGGHGKFCWHAQRRGAASHLCPY